MKLSDFIMLNEGKKKLAVFHQGVLVAKRSNSTQFFFLFQMDHFYVEMHCCINTKEIAGYKMFHRPELLEPYLESIAIDDIFN